MIPVLDCKVCMRVYRLLTYRKDAYQDYPSVENISIIERNVRCVRHIDDFRKFNAKMAFGDILRRMNRMRKKQIQPLFT